MTRRWPTALLVLLLLGAAAPGLAQMAAPKPVESPKLDEVEALRIGKLAAERALVMEEFKRGQLEQAERQRVFAEKNAALTNAINEAATKAGLDVKEGWRPDPDRGVWVK
jgi:hypothetical protein